MYATLQSVDGVESVDIDRLDLKNTDPAFRWPEAWEPAPYSPLPRLFMLPARRSKDVAGRAPGGARLHRRARRST